MSTPHRCPICEGRGIVPQGFYSYPASQESYGSSDITPHQCRQCSGAGVLWSPATPNDGKDDSKELLAEAREALARAWVRIPEGNTTSDEVCQQCQAVIAKIDVVRAARAKDEK